MTKRCCTCREDKPIEEFHHWNRSPDGHVKRCKKCARMSHNNSRRRHKDKINRINREAYVLHKPRIRATQSKYLRNRREKARSGDKAIHAQILFKAIRYRAKRKGIPFNIEASDIVISDLCPVLGLKLEMSLRQMSPASATVDRIEPAKGYTKGNIIVVSLKANVIKSDATVDELLRVAHFYKNLRDSR